MYKNKKKNIKRKFYELIGKITLLICGWVACVAVGCKILVYIVCNCITTIN